MSKATESAMERKVAISPTSGAASLRAASEEKAYAALWSGRRAALRSLTAAIKREDLQALEQLYEEWREDLTLLPSTPAWTGWGVAGRLAVVSQKLVFFQEKLLGGWKVRFMMDGTRVTVKGHPLAWTGTVGMRLDDGESHHTVVLTPPRYVNLKEVSAPAEEPGWAEVVEKLGGGFGSLGSAVDSTSEALGLDQITEIAGEAFSAFKSLRIARVHRSMWAEILNRLSKGESAPFLASDEPARAAKPRRSRAARRASERVFSEESSTAERLSLDGGESELSADLTIKHLAEQSGLTAEQLGAIVEAISFLSLKELKSHGYSRIPRLGTLVLNKTAVGFRPTAEFRAAVNGSGGRR
ncbi:hypothetical protein [Terrabacter sp. Root85]|uniref:hypothetical protein n=1 Tax=Terrabacter sp. Root85 TaxID=1736603 RepID=UPI000A5B4E1F|nr:hypothetical protein [Terrabacter sp. Root85]